MKKYIILLLLLSLTSIANGQTVRATKFVATDSVISPTVKISKIILNGVEYTSITGGSASSDSLGGYYVDLSGVETGDGLLFVTDQFTTAPMAPTNTSANHVLYMNATNDSIISRSNKFYMSNDTLIINTIRVLDKINFPNGSSFSSAPITMPLRIDSTMLAYYGTRLNATIYKTDADSIAIDSLCAVSFDRANGDTVSVRVIWGASRTVAQDSTSDLRCYHTGGGVAASSTKVIPPNRHVWIKVVEMDGAPKEIFFELKGRRKR
jgi:hypothetical protein